MTHITRRMVLRNSLAAAAVGSLARPFIANAAASTWTQGFVSEENTAFKKLVDDYRIQPDPLRAVEPEGRLGDDRR